MGLDRKIKLESRISKLARLVIREIVCMFIQHNQYWDKKGNDFYLRIILFKADI